MATSLFDSKFTKNLEVAVNKIGKQTNPKTGRLYGSSLAFTVNLTDMKDRDIIKDTTISEFQGVFSGAKRHLVDDMEKMNLRLDFGNVSSTPDNTDGETDENGAPIYKNQWWLTANFRPEGNVARAKDSVVDTYEDAEWSTPTESFSTPQDTDDSVTDA